MTNAELIAALRNCGGKQNCLTCSLFAVEASTNIPCMDTLMNQAADLIEEQAKRIAELEAQLPKEGKWKCSYPEIEPNPMFMYGICSICGFEQAISNKLNYCPNCGAKMKKGANDDNA